MKKILITGANSYVGVSFENYINQFDGYELYTLDMQNPEWENYNFEGYDVVFHVAGIAHIKETDANRDLYYSVNRDLAIKTAIKAKNSGVRQFILMSTMSVYGKVVGSISKNSDCFPVNAYGKSKLMADEYISKLEDTNFKVAILRPPMIYGYGCKGNYQLLRKFALKIPVFPEYYNERSMIFVDNLSFFVKELIDNCKSGIFIPQNKEYVSTTEMVKLIAKCNKKNLIYTKLFNVLIRVFKINTVKKVFGNLIYEKADLVEHVDFAESIRLTEKNCTNK